MGGTGHDEETQAKRSLEFLSEASKVFSKSLKYKQTLKSVARLMVPEMADWCAVDMLVDGKIERLATAHIDPAKVEMALEISRRYPVDPNSPTGVPRVLRTGKSELYEKIDPGMLKASIKNPEQLELFLSIGFTSVMLVPLIARGQALGIISLITAESQRHYDKTDLIFAEELAGRAASAIDNARLFDQAKTERERLEFAQDAGGIGTFDWNIVDDTIFVTPQLERLHGLKTGTLSGKLIDWEQGTNIHPEDRQRIKTAVSACLANNKPYIVEYRIILPNGKCRWLVQKAALIKDASGKPKRLTGVDIDISNIKRAEEALMNSESFFREMAEALPQIIWITRADGTNEFCNKRWYEYTGQKQFESILTGSVLHPDDVARTTKLWRQSLKTGTTFRIEYRMKNGTTGEYQWFLGLSTPLRGADGVITKWFGSCTDITESKLLEQQKDDFVAIASHELKTPVTSIKAYAQILERRFNKRGDMEAATYLTKMNTQLDKLTHLIGDLLDVTKIESGKLELRNQTVNFAQLIKDTVELVQLTSDTHEIVIEGNDNFDIQCDPDRLAQVITNLLSNAVKYSPEQSKVTIGVVHDEENVTVRVQDKGVGIPSDDQDKIFERFFRVEGKITESFPGLGLGLYISAEIIKRLDGKIWLQSNSNKGSTFYFSLPLHTAVTPSAVA